MKFIAAASEKIEMFSFKCKNWNTERVGRRSARAKLVDVERNVAQIN